MVTLIIIILFSPAFIVGGVKVLSALARSLPARRA